ncbi:ribokinase [Actinomyces sp. Chiba101]|uniref:ribokinase n=1 Tax=Actinomyces TaxID=1654 RepID=UPI000974ECF2|nr:MULTISPECIES: ribokinase [Actinomyces]BAW92709.1 ribokinase [Actinomyces sp. Chiba101]GAV94325.1 ribokinase [Actinomyces denticolens]SUU07498.1 Ribokinase [Actinomyces denticolens]
MDIAVIGSNMVDLISYIHRMPAEGETVEAPDFAMGCGGKGANQAVAAARLGSSVRMVTRVGNDIFADNTIANFRRNGIDTTYVMPTEATSGVAPIFVDEESHNSIIIVKGANALLTPDDVRAAEEDIAACRLIVLQLEIPLETVYEAVALGKRHGIPVLLNPAPAQPDLVLGRVRDCEYIVPNETELSLLTGMPVETMDDVRNAASVLLDVGIPNVIVTLGERGALWLTAEGERVIDAVAVDAHDTTGAGDAFIGCFSHCLVADGDVLEALRRASHYAADSVTKPGTQSSYADAEQFARLCGAQ